MNILKETPSCRLEDSDLTFYQPASTPNSLNMGAMVANAAYGGAAGATAGFVRGIVMQRIIPDDARTMTHYVMYGSATGCVVGVVLTRKKQKPVEAAYEYDPTEL